MVTELEALRRETDKALAERRPADAIAYLAEWCARVPEDRHTRTALAIALGDAGNPAGALRALRALADRLAHQGYLLPAMVVIRHGLEHAGNDPGLVATLERLHVRGARAKAGNLPTPPPLKAQAATPDAGATAATLLALPAAERLERVAQLACDLGPAGAATAPLPMPLFSELDRAGFVETVRRLHYRRLAAGTKVLVEGAPGDSLFVVVSGQLAVKKGETELATVGPGSVLGEMALITGSPRSATAVAKSEIEVFELTRADVEKLARELPAIAEELVQYARNRLIANLLQTSPMFKRFDENTRYGLIGRFQRQGFAPGAKIITQGTAGTGLFVIAAGEVEVSVAKGGESVVVANLGPGDVFGEIALMHDQPTTATVTARGNVGALFLPRAEFQKVLEGNPQVRTYLEGLGADRLKASQVATEGEAVEADDLIVL
jgi:CRP-like cAMP-binding protein